MASQLTNDEALNQLRFANPRQFSINMFRRLVTLVNEYQDHPNFPEMLNEFLERYHVDINFFEQRRGLDNAGQSTMKFHILEYAKNPRAFNILLSQGAKIFDPFAFLHMFKSNLIKHVIDEKIVDIEVLKRMNPMQLHTALSGVHEDILIYLLRNGLPNDLKLFNVTAIYSANVNLARYMLRHGLQMNEEALQTIITARTIAVNQKTNLENQLIDANANGYLQEAERIRSNIELRRRRIIKLNSILEMCQRYMLGQSPEQIERDLSMDVMDQILPVNISDLVGTYSYMEADPDGDPDEIPHMMRNAGTDANVGFRRNNQKNNCNIL